MHSISSVPPASSFDCLFEHYLPLSRTRDEQGYDQDCEFSHMLSVYIVHSAVLPLLQDASGRVDEILPHVHTQIDRIERAHPAWTAAVEEFAANAAPRLQDMLDALPCERWAWEEVIAESLETEFFARLAPHRSGEWEEADCLIREELRTLKSAGYADMDDTVGLLRWALRGIPQAARLYRMLLAKWSYDGAMEHARVQTAHAIEQTFGLAGVRLSGDDPQWAFSIPLYEHCLPWWPVLPLDTLARLLRVTRAEWSAMHPDESLSSYKQWLYEIACLLERHCSTEEPVYA